jgi:4-hydroxybenzoate polyprenyltransferase
MRGIVQDAVPLCVDLDGTLVSTDTLFESLISLIKQNPWFLLILPWWLLSGRAVLKRRVAERVPLDAAGLPYQPEFLRFLQAEKQAGRTLVLATAADRLVAEAVSRHLGIFDEVIASEPGANLKGTAKLDALQRRFASGFDYAGNSRADLPVWRHSRHSIVVNASPSLLRAAGKISGVTETFTRTEGRLAASLRALRLYQWPKNLLIFVPLVAGHRLFDWQSVSHAAAAFVAFCLCASCAYIVNDLLDLDADRRHPSKRARPLASGALPPVYGLALAVPLLLGSLSVSLLLSRSMAAVLLLYFCLTLLYSFRLKRLLLLDVFTLSGLYTLRIVGGGVAAGIPISSWLCAFSIFVFLSLAFSKRVSELRRLTPGEGQAHGRAYRQSDLEQLNLYGVASGFLSSLVFALYINSGNVHGLYQRPQVLWLLFPVLLYWITRIWLLSWRGELNEDPILFAIRDPATYLVVLISAVILLLATTSWLPPLDSYQQ